MVSLFIQCFDYVIDFYLFIINKKELLLVPSFFFVISVMMFNRNLCYFYLNGLNSNVFKKWGLNCLKLF